LPSICYLTFCALAIYICAFYISFHLGLLLSGLLVIYLPASAIELEMHIAFEHYLITLYFYGPFCKEVILLGNEKYSWLV